MEKLFKNNIIDEKEKFKLSTHNAIAPKMYGLPKIHKVDTPLRPICSSINSPSYNLCKFIVNILKNIMIESKYNIKNSTEFQQKIKDNYIMDDERLISFDVISLFPSIPVEFAIKTIENRWKDIKKYTKMDKTLFMDIVKFCIRENRYFTYKGKVYKQLKGMPMGSPASPIIADLIMEELLDNCMEKFKCKPRLLTKYVDDIFAIVKIDYIDETLNILNEEHRCIKFTKEEENNDELPYLDTKIIRYNMKLKIDWYKKDIASNRLMNYTSYHNKSIIINTAQNFINKVLTISDPIFHTKNRKLIKEVLIKNAFPTHLINRLIKNFYKKKSQKQTHETKTFRTCTWVPEFSNRLKNSKQIFDNSNFNLAFKTENKVNKLFTKLKDKTNKDDKSNIVYQIPCSGDGTNNCNKVYVGTTKNKLKTRLATHKSEHKRNNNSEPKTALAAHCRKHGHTADFNNIKILAEESNYKKRLITEMLHIVNTSPNKRINFKTDIENCSHIYRSTIEKFKNNKK